MRKKLTIKNILDLIDALDEGLSVEVYLLNHPEVSRKELKKWIKLLRKVLIADL